MLSGGKEWNILWGKFYFSLSNISEGECLLSVWVEWASKEYRSENLPPRLCWPPGALLRLSDRGSRGISTAHCLPWRGSGVEVWRDWFPSLRDILVTPPTCPVKYSGLPSAPSLPLPDLEPIFFKQSLYRDIRMWASFINLILSTVHPSGIPQFLMCQGHLFLFSGSAFIF